jgi:hypothetical protein
MNPILMAGVVIVQLALLSYTVGVVLEQRGRRVTPVVLAFLTAGVVFDITATACMMFGTTKSLWTLHGILGYSALAAMLVDTVRIWRHRLRAGEAEVPKGLHLFSRYAYLWWVVAYITGAALVAMSRRGGA